MLFFSKTTRDRYTLPFFAILCRELWELAVRACLERNLLWRGGREAWQIS